MIAEVVLHLEVPNGTQSETVCRAVRRAILTDGIIERDVRPTMLFPARCRFVDAPPVASDAVPAGTDMFAAGFPGPRRTDG